MQKIEISFLYFVYSRFKTISYYERFSNTLQTLSSKHSSKMSAEQVTMSPIVDAVVVNNKKPVLSGKYSKFMTFGYWIISQSDVSVEMKQQVYNQLRMFGSVEEQTELFEQFFTEEKVTAKTLRKLVVEHNKPPKPIKEKTTKTSRKGKAVVQQDALISQLIADANADAVETPVEKQSKEAEKEAARLAKEAEKEAARLAKEAEKEAVKLAKEAEKEAARLAKEAEKEAARLAKEAAKLTKETKKKPSTKNTKEVEVNPETPVVEVNTETPVVEVNTETPVAVVETEKQTTTKEKTEKKKNAKKTVSEPVVNAVPQPVVNDVTTEKIGEELVPEVIEETITKPTEQPKKTKKTKEPAAEKAPKTEKAKKTKESKTVAPVQPVPVAEDEEDQEIQTRVATIGDKDYLIDQDFNVYNMEEPHDQIGKYNQETGLLELA